MSYPTNTILTADVEMEPVEQFDGTETPHPLNRVRVIGPSPISTSSVAEWNGIGGNALIVEPVDEFGATEVVPVAILQQMYTVEAMGDEVNERTERKIDPVAKQQQLKSPEAVFAEETKNAERKKIMEASEQAAAVAAEEAEAKAAALAEAAKKRGPGRPRKDANESA